MDLYRAGRVTIVNAPGGGIADDKAIYSYVPEIIQFYTGQRPILQNVPTWRCSIPDELSYVLAHLPELVVKEVHGSGGYGMLVGPTASRREIEAFRAKLRARPENYIAQPTLALSTCPAVTQSGIAPRHVDLRPYVLVGDRVRIVPGGLTRVALKKGSLVVNSSQGGGTKDTWVLAGLSMIPKVHTVVGQDHARQGAEASRCSDAPPKACSGCRGRSSARRTWRGLPRPASASRSRPTPATATARNGARRWRAPASSISSWRNTATPRSTRRSTSSSSTTTIHRRCAPASASARTNARFVRTKITRDMWEAMNSTWLAYDAIKPEEMTAARLPELIDWIRQRTALFRGSLLGTILRDDGYFFSQLGAFVERADNTARILDVKYFILLPSNQMIGGEIDTYQWETILRSVSAHRAYRHVFHENYRPWNVADFLILHAEMPRSLRFCYDWLSIAIEGLARSTASGRRPPTSSPRRATC